MMNGIYRAIYHVPGDMNEGVVFIDNGKMYGADKTHAFYGIYTVSDTSFSGKLTRCQHSASGYNMGGGGNELSLIGTVDGETLKGEVTIAGIPQKIKFTLLRITEIIGAPQ